MSEQDPTQARIEGGYADEYCHKVKLSSNRPSLVCFLDAGVKGRGRKQYELHGKAKDKTR